jgi:hypothetical protein
VEHRRDVIPASAIRREDTRRLDHALPRWLFWPTVRTIAIRLNSVPGCFDGGCSLSRRWGRFNVVGFDRPDVVTVFQQAGCQCMTQ